MNDVATSRDLLLNQHFTAPTLLIAQSLTVVATWQSPLAILFALDFLNRLGTLHIFGHVSAR